MKIRVGGCHMFHYGRQKKKDFSLTATLNDYYMYMGLSYSRRA